MKYFAKYGKPLFSYVEKLLEYFRKTRLILQLMRSQPRKQTIAIHTLLNISRTKGNQTIKFGQLIKYNIRNIFLEKSYTKCGGETIPRPLSKK